MDRRCYRFFRERSMSRLGLEPEIKGLNPPGFLVVPMFSTAWGLAPHVGFEPTTLRFAALTLLHKPRARHRVVFQKVEQQLADFFLA